MDFTKEIKNTAADYYVVANVEQGKKYRITAKVDQRIYFRYAVVAEDGSRKFIGSPVDIWSGTFKHTLPVQTSGQLVIDSLINKNDYWTVLEVISFEEV